jgi:hypothetical protein
MSETDSETLSTHVVRFVSGGRSRNALLEQPVSDERNSGPPIAISCQSGGVKFLCGRRVNDANSRRNRVTAAYLGAITQASPSGIPADESTLVGQPQKPVLDERLEHAVAQPGVEAPQALNLVSR